MSVKNTQKLKQFQSQKIKLKTEIESMNQSIQEQQIELSIKRKKLNQLSSKIKKLCTKDLVISEHAMLRYIERAFNIDLEELKNQMLDMKTKQLIRELGPGKYPIANGLKAVVRGNTIISIVPN